MGWYCRRILAFLNAENELNITGHLSTLSEANLKYAVLLISLLWSYFKKKLKWTLGNSLPLKVKYIYINKRAGTQHMGLSLGFQIKGHSNHSPQLQRLARKLTFSL